MSDPSGSIQHVSDTARWVALYRAMESERPDALFHDSYARRLAGTRGEQILGAMRQGRRWAWPMIVRTAVMDELILRAIDRDRVGTVLNLAAGLDARPYRLPLAPSLRWIDVDFPDVVAYKQAQLAGERPACALEYVGLDLSDVGRRRALFAQIGAAARQVLVVSEGLLIYLTREQVGTLARDLATQPAFAWWLIDLASPRLLKMMDRTWGRAVAAGSAPFQFAPPEGTAFFQPFGWREAEFRSTWEESLRLKRTMSLAWLWKLIGRLYPRRKREEFRRFSGIVLLSRLLIAGLLAGAACARPVPSTAGPNVVTIPATDYAFGGPDTIPPGLTTLRMVNIGKELHQAGLARIAGNRTTADIVAGLKAIAPPPWLVFAGGPDIIPPGDTANATQALAPGRYMLVCFFPSPDGKMHLEKGMFRPLVVRGTAGAGGAAAADPTGDITLTLKDYGFDLDKPIGAGSHTFRVENAGPQLHEVMVVALAPGKTASDLLAWAAQGMKGQPPGRPLGGIVALSQGVRAAFSVTLAPGTYVLACFVPDARDGKPHTAHGMVRQIAVN